MRKKDIIELGITCVLVSALLFLLIQAAKRKQTGVRQERPGPKMVVQGRPLPADSIAGERGLFRRLEQEAKDLKLSRDPFVPQPVSSTDEAPFSLVLRGIVWDKESPKAIINESILGIGDSIGGNIIVEIKQDRVILSDGIRNLEIRLGQ